MTRRIRVLVADDEKNLRELLARELERKGHQVDGAADGLEALERLKETAYDVIVLDMRMPRLGGIELLRELQTLPEHPQVIVMTGVQEVSTAVPLAEAPAGWGSGALRLPGLDLTRFAAACERRVVTRPSRTPALWVLGSRRRRSATAGPLELERRQAYAAMDPGERLARALAFSSFASRLRGSARLSRRP